MNKVNIPIEVYKGKRNKLWMGVFIGFWVGYSPFIIHQMQWLR
jgi:hypothetical protein